MEDKETPKSIGESILSPSSLTPSQEELCYRLDELAARQGLKTKLSDMFRGAIFAIRPECRANPEWMAQAAHSFREILYPFGKSGVPNKEQALKDFGSVRADDPKFTGEVGKVFGSFTELAHHGNCFGATPFEASDFDKLIADFERVMSDVLMRQSDVHDEVDQVVAENS